MRSPARAALSILLALAFVAHGQQSSALDPGRSPRGSRTNFGFQFRGKLPSNEILKPSRRPCRCDEQNPGHEQPPANPEPRT